MKHLRRTLPLALFLLSLLASSAAFRTESVTAQVFDGPGLIGGVELADNVEDLPDADNPRQTVVDILEAILNFVALIAVIMVIIAGFYLVLSMGNEEQRDKAKRIILYTLAGLIVILFARIIVGLVTVFLADQL